MKKIVMMELAFYVDSDAEGHDKMDAITDAVDDAMDCKHGAVDDSDYDESAPCSMVSMSGQIMTEEQYDEWFDRMYPEKS